MQRIIITGGSSGLGYEIAKLFLAKKYEVVCLTRHKPDLSVSHIVTDLTSEESITNAVKEIEKTYSDFSLFISCAAVGHIEKIEEMTREKSKEMFDVNVFGPSIITSKLLPSIKKNGADIAYIGATIGYKANEFMPLYSITKRGLRGLIENVRSELKSTPCRVVGIHPGGLDTQSNIGPDGRETIVGQLTGKTGTKVFMKASDIAEIVYQTVTTPKNIELSEVIINKK